MSRGWAAVADIGRGLMERDARKKELEEERKYAQEQADAQWEREAEKRKAEEELRLLRIETEKAKAARERQGLALDAGNAQIGKVVGGQRFYQKPVEGSEGLFEIGREEVGPSAAERLRSADSRARTGAIQSSANARQQEVLTAREEARRAASAEARNREATAIELKALKEEAALREKIAAHDPMNRTSPAFNTTPEEWSKRLTEANSPTIRALWDKANEVRNGKAADPKAESKSSAPGSSKETAIRVSWEEVDSVPDGTWITLPNGKTGQK